MQFTPRKMLSGLPRNILSIQNNKQVVATGNSIENIAMASGF